MYKKGLKILRGNQKSSIEEGQTIQCNRKVWRYQGVFWLSLGIFKPVYCIALSVLLQWTTFDYPFVSSNLSFTLCCLSFFNGRLLIIPWYLQIFQLHCIVCPTSMDDFWSGLKIHRGNQKSSIEEGQTIQCNRQVWRYQGVIKSRPLKKDRQYNVKERFEDTKG
jgi:hypothetical protein